MCMHPHLEPPAPLNALCVMQVLKRIKNFTGMNRLKKEALKVRLL